jgi:hypothetical protein
MLHAVSRLQMRPRISSKKSTFYARSFHCASAGRTWALVTMLDVRAMANDCSSALLMIGRGALTWPIVAANALSFGELVWAYSRM